MRRRRPQDPTRGRARAFHRALQRDPEHRQRALARRLHNQHQDSENLGMLAAGLLVFGIVFMGLWRVLTGSMW